MTGSPADRQAIGADAQKHGEFYGRRKGKRLRSRQDELVATLLPSLRLDVSQPSPLSQGQTTVVPQTRLDVDEGDNKLIALDAGTTLTDVVKALNGLGATPRDIIAIMQALKAAGALRAELVIL